MAQDDVKTPTTAKPVIKTEEDMRELCLAAASFASAVEAALAQLETKLSLLDWTILEALGREGGGVPAEVSARTGVPRPLLVASARKLLRAELIDAEPSEGHPIGTITLTAKGQAKVADVASFLATFTSELNAARPSLNISPASRVLKHLASTMAKSGAKMRAAKAEAKTAAQPAGNPE